MAVGGGRARGATPVGRGHRRDEDALSLHWDTYGCFPATIDPFLMTVWYQAAHLDVASTTPTTRDEALPAHVRLHMRDWHGL